MGNSITVVFIYSLIALTMGCIGMIKSDGDLMIYLSLFHLTYGTILLIGIALKLGGII